MTITADVVVIGAGFGGSLAALVTHRIGLETVVLDRGAHPRFAIGESSTPLADLALRDLAERYDLPRLAPLTEYGTWRRTYPEIMRGLKRGFSYFKHDEGVRFSPDPEHANELLVEANPDDEHSDTQWLRADVDRFLVEEVTAAGIPYYDHTSVDVLDEGDPWRLAAHRDRETIRIETPFIIDASGRGSVLREALDLGDESRSLRTRSRSLFSHFTGVRRWRDLYEAAGGSTAEHPFDCDAAALHHILDGAWMWLLRFDDDVVSAGFVMDLGEHPLDEAVSPEEEWREWLDRYPSLAEQFAKAKPIRPITRTGKLQRLSAETVGPGWAMLPSTAGFLDPLHSTGIAHNISGIERLAAFLESGAGRGTGLETYRDALHREFHTLDRLIHGCYASFDRFDLMVHFSMHYFAGAIHSEHRRRDGRHETGDGFLMCHDVAFRAAVERGYETVTRLGGQADLAADAVAAFGAEIRSTIDDYNYAGLCDPSKKNMYEYG